MQAGPCVRSNQLDYDEDVMFKVCIDDSVDGKDETNSKLLCSKVRLLTLNRPPSTSWTMSVQTHILGALLL
jgi:hypothetical protein